MLVHFNLLNIWANLCVGNTLNSQVLNYLIHCNLSDKISRICDLFCSETDCPRLEKLNVVSPKYNSASTKISYVYRIHIVWSHLFIYAFQMISL